MLRWITIFLSLLLVSAWLRHHYVWQRHAQASMVDAQLPMTSQHAPTPASSGAMWQMDTIAGVVNAADVKTATPQDHQQAVASQSNALLPVSLPISYSLDSLPLSALAKQRLRQRYGHDAERWDAAESLNADTDFEADQLQPELDAQELAERSAELDEAAAENSAEDEADATEAEPIGPFAYEISYYQLGTDKQGVVIDDRPVALNMINSLPDYPSINQRSKDPDRFVRKMISIGFGGVIQLQVRGGVVVDHTGADFIVFSRPLIVRQRFTPTPARVAVRGEGTMEWREFPCDCTTGMGCAGVVPSALIPGTPLSQAGGDGFDIGALGLDRVEEIRITDCNNQLSKRGSSDRRYSGIDIDSVALTHTERNKI